MKTNETTTENKAKELALGRRARVRLIRGELGEAAPHRSARRLAMKKENSMKAFFLSSPIIRGADGKERVMRQCGAHKPSEVHAAWVARGRMQAPHFIG